MLENKSIRYNGAATVAVPTPETILSETEAAKYLGVSRMTMLRLRQSEQIGYYRVGHRVLFSIEKHLIPFLEKCAR